MPLFLGIDPGTQGNAAWAIYDTGRQQVARCGLGDIWEVFGPVPCSFAMIEVPRQYPGMGAKLANDLITLAVYAGSAKFFCGFCLRVETKLVYPQDWKGQLSKEVTEARILKRQPESKALVDALGIAQGLRNNVFDAIGIAMHSAGFSLKDH